MGNKKRKSNDRENTEDDEKLQNQADVEDSGHKRQHTDEVDSDTEQTHKKIKRKKKQVVEPDPNTSKKAKKSIRQMKREKHAQRQAEAELAAKDELKSQCLSYLSQWKHDKQNWKFMKIKQVWLLKNKFSTNNVPNESWPTLLEYFESAKGNVRNILLDDAHKIIKQMDDWTEEQGKDENKEDEDEETEGVKKPNDIVYDRARSLIQCLEE